MKNSFFNVRSLKAKVLLTTAVACLICLVIAVFVASIVNERSLEDGIVSKARAIDSRLEEVSKFVALQNGLKPALEKYTSKYKSPSEITEQEKFDLLKQVPIYATMEIGKQEAEKDHYSFRVFSDQPRKKENLANPNELTIFHKFENNPSLEEYVVSKDGLITLFKPVRLTSSQGCLTCHGNPSTSPWKNGQDILGYPMEDWKDGKLHGVFALSTKVADVKFEQAQKEFLSKDKQIGIFISAGAILALFFAAFIMRRPIGIVEEVCARLTADSAEVGAAVSQIFSVSQALSAATIQQSESIQSTSASIEEISAMVKRSAENAADSLKVSTSSKLAAERGCEIVSKMMSSIGDIDKSNEQVCAAIDQSNQKTSEIVKMILEIGTKTKIINDIVFQTKLLSFNASVEAARAGEHGKGFAVVAEEIGNLASMSGHAAKEITQLLDESIGKVKGIVEETRSTVDRLISEAKATVETGANVARECEEVLSEIVSSSARVCQMVEDISTASMEQDKGIVEIAKAIQQIDKATQIGASSAESCSTSAEQLAERSKGLRNASASLRFVVEGKKTISRFKWGDEYALNIEIMDNEHKVLIEKMNRLAELFEEANNASSSEIKQAFTDLASYTQTHFAHEEKYLHSIAYPELEAHKNIHKTLLTQVMAFGEKIDKGICEGNELMDFLNNWLMRHILGVDMKYGRYAKKFHSNHEH